MDKRKIVVKDSRGDEQNSGSAADEKRNPGRDKSKDSRTTLDKYRENGYDSGFVFHED